jgi:hypothetical protein
MSEDVVKHGPNRLHFNYMKKQKSKEHQMMHLIAELNRNLKQNTSILLQMKSSLSNLSIYNDDLTDHIKISSNIKINNAQNSLSNDSNCEESTQRNEQV